MKSRTIYYNDVLTDDFAGTDIKQKKVGENYVYIRRNPFYNALAFVFYRLVATPLVFLFDKIGFHEKIVGKEKLKMYRKSGYFLYGNHVHIPADAFTPSLITFPKKAYIMVNPDATSIPVVGGLVKMLGGMPVPDDITTYKKFVAAVKERAGRGDVIVVYPEEHIWPYYTGIRPFKDTSFKYPAQTDKPVFVFTRTFVKRKFSKRPKFVVYVDGPFFPDVKLSVKENQKILRDKAYDAMLERSRLSDCVVNNYLKTE